MPFSFGALHFDLAFPRSLLSGKKVAHGVSFWLPFLILRAFFGANRAFLLENSACGYDQRKKSQFAFKKSPLIMWKINPKLIFLMDSDYLHEILAQSRLIKS